MKKTIGFAYKALGFFLFLFYLNTTSAQNNHVTSFPLTPTITTQISYPSASSIPAGNHLSNLIILIPLYSIIVIIFIYAVRHYIFTFSRLFGRQRNLYAEIIHANWPTVTILVPAHNEENVIADLLSALLQVDYPKHLMQIIVLNDRSTDSTEMITDNFAEKNPGLITAFHRKSGLPGKSAALKDVIGLIKHDITIIFDADNLPGPALIKQLVSPFFDPEVGAVMGRVVPGNVEKNLLTRLIEMERSGGYQVNQQARENLCAVPQYGGTTGGIRTLALEKVGGWNEKLLAEDTEITFRLLCNNWKVVYQNNAECHEQTPETWKIRIKQISRWAKGHNQVLFRYFHQLIFNRHLKLIVRLDGLLLLCMFLISPLLLLGWLLFIFAYFFNIVPEASGILAFFAIVSYSGIGNFTIFYEIATAIYLDKSYGTRSKRIRLLPFNYFNFFVSMFVLSKAFIEQITISQIHKKVVWDRTDHPRRNPQQNPATVL